MTATVDSNARLAEALAQLAADSYRISASHGFHDHDHIDAFLGLRREQQAKIYAELQDTKRLFLMVGELVEAFEELRAAHAPAETYYTLAREYEYCIAAPHTFDCLPKGAKVDASEKARLEARDPEGTVGLFKPEGIPSEIADVLIRIMDYAEVRGVPVAAAVIEKAAFNQTREHRHGRQF